MSIITLLYKNLYNDIKMCYTLFMDYKTFCENYCAITGIPVVLVKSIDKRRGVPVYSTMEALIGYRMRKDWPIYPSSRNPEFAFTTPDIEYGRIDIEDTDLHIVLGPVLSIPLTEEILKQYMKETVTPDDYKEAIEEALSAIPKLTHAQFARHLVFVCLCVNGHSDTAEELIGNSREMGAVEAISNTAIKADESEIRSYSETYAFERELYARVAAGNEKALLDFLSHYNLTKIKEAKLASTTIRHAKNQFVATAAKLVTQSAIPGGMPVDEAYELMCLYVNDCEKLQSLEGIANLEQAMVFDICRRMACVKEFEGISDEVRDSMRFVRNNTDRNISVDDVAANVKRSPSYISGLFKKELGITIGAYISRCKLEEAKSLLASTDMSLADISNELCYSSQAYFQNVFKRQYGMTPGEFRKKNAK